LLLVFYYFSTGGTLFDCKRVGLRGCVSNIKYPVFWIEALLFSPGIFQPSSKAGIHCTAFHIVQSLWVAEGWLLLLMHWDLPSAPLPLRWAWSSQSADQLLPSYSYSCLVVTVLRNILELGFSWVLLPSPVCQVSRASLGSWRLEETIGLTVQNQMGLCPEGFSPMYMKLTHSLNKQTAYVRAQK